MSWTADAPGRGCSGRRRTCGARGMEVTEHLPIGGDKRGLVVTNRVLGTEVTHETLGPAQVRPRHGGEEVVLDLEIEAAEDESGQPPAADVAGGKDLTAQKAQLHSFTEHRHADVVGGEGAAEIEAEQPLVDDDKDDGAQWREHSNDRAEVGPGVPEEQGSFDKCCSAAASPQ